MPLVQRSLAIQEKTPGPDHPGVATSLSWLATLYDRQARYADAEPLLERLLAINEKTLASDSPYVAELLTRLSLLYYNQGRYANGNVGTVIPTGMVEGGEPANGHSFPSSST